MTLPETPRRTPANDLADLVNDLVSLLPRPRPWAEFKAEVLPAFRRPLVSQSYENRVKALIEMIEAIDLADEGDTPRFIQTTADLSPTLVARFIQSRGDSGESLYTLRSRLVLLQRFTRLAGKFRCLAIDPFDIRPVKKMVRVGKPRNKRALTREETRRLFEVLRSDVATKQGWALYKARRLLSMVAIALGTGVRRRELLKLQVRDVDVDARVIQLVPRDALGRGLKSEGSAQPVGMPLAIVPDVREWLSHRLDAPAGFPVDPACPWVFPTLSRKGPWLHGTDKTNPLGRLKVAGRRAGIPDLTFQMLRRTTATLMEFHGAGVAQVKRQLRHSDPETTSRHYLMADARNIAEAVKDLSFE